MKPLCQNDYKINTEFCFTKEQPPLDALKENPSYDVDSLFTNIPVQ